MNPYLETDRSHVRFIIVWFVSLSTLFCLTAIVPTALWGAVKKNGALRQHVACRLIEEKRSRCFVCTLLIKAFKYGSSLSVLTE